MFAFHASCRIALVWSLFSNFTKSEPLRAMFAAQEDTPSYLTKAV